MYSLVKFIFSMGVATVLMLAIEYIVMEGGEVNGNPIAVVGFVLTVIIFRAISSFETKEAAHD